MSNELELENTIKKIFFEVFPNLSETEFSWDKEQKDYASWDSFAQLNLITFAESKFDITLSLEESIDIKSARDLLECVRSHLK
jgi:acyl carrier protein